MSGGAYEYVAAYVNNGNSSLSSYGSTLVGAAEKYADVYRASSTSGSDNQQTNYNYSQPTTGLGQPTATSGHYGDAVWETSNNYSSGDDSWYSDYSSFPSTSNPFFLRGGFYRDTSIAGVFNFHYDNGFVGSSRGFRVVLPLAS